MDGFRSLGLADWLCSQVKLVGFKEPEEVQKRCIPPVLKGENCIACARTGSGKTAAFALPILHKLSEDPYGIFALILTPTRELAYQISEQFEVFGKHISVNSAVIVGGVDVRINLICTAAKKSRYKNMMKQSVLLAQSPHIVVCTPGRLADHLRSTDTVMLDRIKFLVLDEADRLIESSFTVDLETIFNALQPKRQTLLFGVTLTENLKRLKDLHLADAFFWQDSIKPATVEGLDQRYALMPAQVKDCYFVHLLRLLHDEKGKSVIVFTHTCRSCQVYALMLQQLEFPCIALHSLMSQGQRLASLNKFKSHRVRIMVATNVASRGLDVPNVGVVINLNVPADPSDYVHRVGRTSRRGKEGLCITLVTEFDVRRLRMIEEHIHCRLGEYQIQESEAVKDIDTIGLARKETEVHYAKMFVKKQAMKRRKKHY